MHPAYASNNPARRIGCRIVDDDGFVVSAVDLLACCRVAVVGCVAANLY